MNNPLKNPISVGFSILITIITFANCVFDSQSNEVILFHCFVAFMSVTAVFGFLMFLAHLDKYEYLDKFSFQDIRQVNWCPAAIEVLQSRINNNQKLRGIDADTMRSIQDEFECSESINDILKKT
ncbi:hypothetical protein [Undibacterium oligocarboniphilum]|uniref:Uncharacterized protein n=1 Tax=Undibacterium oligocarboniphilum TaxID=666702 RepID=A0A850QJV3_9BURK|nr:hypothetical protein [Undibacterium oligocarboniphilum]MBC3871761.1 hypothetical protein [Undibacterium oligocarboniphilum]NVO79397.1 hypothetical protein [Undibacterium oligocarboniphilum]